MILFIIFKANALHAIHRDKTLGTSKYTSDISQNFRYAILLLLSNTYCTKIILISFNYNKLLFCTV